MAYRLLLVAHVVPLAAILPLLGCSTGASTGTDCGQIEQAVQEQSLNSTTWQDEFQEYAATHPPDEEVPVLVEPNTPAIRNALETLGARAFYEFKSFSGLLFSIRTEKLPNITEIEGIVSASLGAQGELIGC